MRHVVAGFFMGTIGWLTACADTMGPPDLAHDPRTVASLMRTGATEPAEAPDSVGIPPSIPPIHEEAPVPPEGME